MARRIELQQDVRDRRRPRLLAILQPPCCHTMDSFLQRQLLPLNRPDDVAVNTLIWYRWAICRPQCQLRNRYRSKALLLLLLVVVVVVV